jgi:arylsulfatase A-like enzyme
MARRPRRAAVAVLVTLAALTSGAALPSGTATPVGVTSSAPAAATSDPAPGQEAEGRAGRTPYERRLREARRDSVGVAPVVGGRDRPNVLVLMLDDMRDDDLQFMPNARRLISERGVRFANSFAPQPLCCPSRASFLTGLYTHNHKVWSHVDPYGFRVFDDRETLPVWMRGLGYETYFLGKYLNGYGRQLVDGEPSSRYVPPGWTDWNGSIDDRTAKKDHLSGGTYRYFDTTLNVNGTLEPHDGAYQTYLYSRLTQQMVRDSARSPNPFFAWISFTAPHGGSPKERDDPRRVELSDGSFQSFQSPARPREVKGRFDQVVTRIPGGEDPKDRVIDKPSFIRGRPPLTEYEESLVLENYRQRAEAVSVVDDELPNIFAALRRSGELDNTYVVLASDNGYFMGEHRMRQGKLLPYEPSLRVPLLVRGPGVPAGEVRADPIMNIDLAPTLMRAVGGRAPSFVDGVDMLDVLLDGDRGWTRPVLTDTGPRAVGSDVKESDNFLVESGDRVLRKRYSVGVRTSRYLYVEHVSDERELYDLRRDPRQRVNLVERPGMREVVRLLARELRRLRDCAGAECSRPLPASLQGEGDLRPWSRPVVPGYRP